jgi:hypothetical protein
MIQSGEYKAYLKSTSVSQGDIWDVHSATEVYHVEKVKLDAQSQPEPITPFTPVNILWDDTTQGAPVIKNIGEQYGGGSDWLSGALVRGIDWNMGGNGRGLTATVRYSTRYFETKFGKGLNRTEENIANATALESGARCLLLPCMVIPTFRTRSMKMYRDNPSMTGPNATNDISASDIGGLQKQRDIDVRQVALKLRFVVDANSQGIDALTGVLQAYVGKKNSDSFLGYGAQNLICDGAAINHLEHEFYEVVMDYLYDEYFHHSQIVQPDQDGRPRMMGTDYADVRWARDARTAVAFNDIWPNGFLGQSMKYQAFMGVWY